jgi:hypothetical protein
MRVKVNTLRELGRNLPGQPASRPPFSGELRVCAERDPELGRDVVRARLLDISQGTRVDLLPDLSDAQLLWAERGQMRLTGVERLGGVSYAQTWSIEVQL